MHHRAHSRARTLVIFLLIIGTLLGVYALLQMKYEHVIGSPIDPSDASHHEFVIADGSSASAIAHQLYSDHLIRSSLAFRIYVSKEGLESKFLAGRYALRRNQSIKEIIATLTDPSASEQWITILEGWRAAEIAEYLDRGGFVNREAFLECVQTCSFDLDLLASKPDAQGLEGYLFPDTYIVSLGSTAETVVEKMVTTMDKKFADALLMGDPEIVNEQVLTINGRTIHEILTMASIIEREVRADDDRPIVSGILWKRLDAGMGLGADATVLYELGDWRAPLTAEALAIDSPYNTRKFRDLPPGPIASPGLKSIEAALYPEESPYWYYLTTTDTGEMKYGRTLDEHNENKAAFL